MVIGTVLDWFRYWFCRHHHPIWQRVPGGVDLVCFDCGRRHEGWRH